MSGRTKFAWAGCALLAVCLATAPIALSAAEGKSESAFELNDLNTIPSLVERERAINAALKEVFGAGADVGAWQHLADRPLQEIDPRQLALDALTRNLSIARGHIRRDIAEAALLEAQALFDPVLNFSFTYTNQQVFDRKDMLVRFRRGTTLTEDPNFPGETTSRPSGQTVFPHELIFFDPPSVVRYIGLDQARPDGYVQSLETASTAPITGNDEAYNLDFDVEQVLPGGAELFLAYQTRKHETHFINNGGNPPDLKLTTYGGYDRPWTSQVTASFTTPTPWSRNFGPEAAQADVDTKLAGLADEQAVWNVRAVINATLLDVELTYWDLVRAVNDLYAAIRNLRNVETLAAGTDRMYELRELTEYDHVQVQAELERVRGDVELAKNDFVRASNALQPLLDRRDSGIFVPTGYTVPLSAPLDIEIEPNDLGAVGANPALRSQDFDVAAANVLARQAQLLQRWDVQFSANVTARQIGTTLGYRGVLDSTEHIFDPDAIDETYNLDVVRPWRNRAARAAADGSAHAFTAQQLSLRTTANSLSRDLNDATVGLISAKARTEITRRNRQLAQLSYDKAVEQQRSRGVTEFEIILQSNALLDANRAWIDAIISAKQAEAQYLAAKGSLAEKYAERTAQTMLDVLRTDKLADQGLVPNFVAEAKND